MRSEDDKRVKKDNRKQTCINSLLWSTTKDVREYRTKDCQFWNKRLNKNQENQIKDCKIWSITKDGNRNTKVSNIGL